MPEATPGPFSSGVGESGWKPTNPAPSKAGRRKGPQEGSAGQGQAEEAAGQGQPGWAQPECRLGAVLCVRPRVAPASGWELATLSSHPASLWPLVRLHRSQWTPVSLLVLPSGCQPPAPAHQGVAPATWTRLPADPTHCGGPLDEGAGLSSARWVDPTQLSLRGCALLPLPAPLQGRRGSDLLQPDHVLC